MFNLVLLPEGLNNNVIAQKVDVGYLVDPDGTINFPVIGRIPVGGLTRQQATEKITNLIKEHVKDPIVNIRYTNFTVTVIGEVARPASFVVPTERITILEAIGLAGDMTVFGKRESVLIIREKDGVRSTTQVSLNSKDILTSPFYYLKQNDIVYVEPDNKVKAASTQPYNRFIGMFTALMTTTVFVILAVR
jgi:polysaccharide export outer membrane protein